MEYEYWGYIEALKDGSCIKWINGVGYETTANQLPKWARDKVVLLDFMEDNTTLQCKSDKVTYNNRTLYYLYKSEDERKKS